jgi:phage gp46-like protein
MADVALEFSTTAREADLVVEAADLKPDDSLRTAVLISLFTHARVDDDSLPPGELDRRGWWGDSFATVPGDKIGSTLWTLQREKLTPALRSRAERLAERALRWLIEDGVAAAVEVSSEIHAPDGLYLRVVVVEPEASRVEFLFPFVWEGVKSAL